MDNLKKEFDYYLAHQPDLVKDYEGKFVVIKGGEVIGSYNDAVKAVTETQKTHEIGTFLVQFVSKGDVAYKQTFHSRAVFS